jgi:multidrug efflux pump subunit AcrA (membrane-fusion protein)
MLGLACSSEAVASRAPAPPPLDVDTALVLLEEVPRTARWTGRLRAERDALVGAGANGRILTQTKDVGQRIHAGEVVATLDVSAAALAAGEATVRTKLAETQRSASARECERARSLFAEGAIARSDLDRALDRCALDQLDTAAARLRASQAQ